MKNTYTKINEENKSVRKERKGGLCVIYCARAHALTSTI